MLISINSLAQAIEKRDSVQVIPAVVIRGTLMRDTLKNIPAAVNVLNEIQLSQNDQTILTPLLNQLPGVYMQQGALNTNRIAIRGIGARTPFGTNRVKAYLDGLPISFADGSTAIDDIDLNVLETVEVIKGPVSSIYGAGLGGVINLYTREPNANRISLGSTFGSFGLFKPSVNASIKLDKTAVFAAYNALQSDGFRENSKYDRQSLTFKLKHRFSEKTELNFLTNLTRLEAFIPSSLNETTWRNKPELADVNWGLAQGYESYDAMLTGISITHRLSQNLRNTTSIFSQIKHSYEPRPFNILDEEIWNIGARTIFNYDFSIFGLSTEIAFGAEYLHEYYTGATLENLYRDFPSGASVAGATISKQKQVRENINYFLQQRLELSKKLALEGGLNLNSTGYKLTTLFAESGIDQSGDYRYKPVWSPRLGLTYKLSSESSLYATASHGFSVPSVEETLTPAGLINTALKPETGINYEAGLKADWLDRKLYTEVALYSIQISNLLVAQRVGDDQFVGVNAGSTTHNGVEVLARYQYITEAKWILRPYASLALQYYRFREFIDGENDYAGNELTGVPAGAINLGLEIFAPNGFRISVNNYTVGQVPLNDANSAYAEGYNLLNSKLSYEANVLARVKIGVNAGVNNILNAHYAASILPNATSFNGSAPRYFYPGSPRNIYVGFKVDYSF